MPLEMIMPALGMAQETGIIVAWHKSAGDVVAAGDVLFEVETDNATMEVEAQGAGVLGRGGMAAPAALHAGPLNGCCGPAMDACAALQRRITLQPGATVDLTFLLGQAASAEAASALIAATRAQGPQDMLDQVKAHWTGLLGSVQITSPDRAMDIMLNGWLLYQTLACRIWARAGLYQASGAYGFRDQLQDGMALASLRPEITRAHLLRAAARQFPEGDVQHWWLPLPGRGCARGSRTTGCGWPMRRRNMCRSRATWRCSTRFCRFSTARHWPPGGR